MIECYIEYNSVYSDTLLSVCDVIMRTSDQFFLM